MYITVIGAGPVGCYASYLLAKAGHQVEIFENHQQIGLPIQCTGILTSDFEEFNFPLDSFLVNTIDKIEVYSPHKAVTVRQKDYIVCRKRFDNFFADLAKQAGAKIYVDHSFVRKENSEIIIKDSKNNAEKKLKPDLVIAADGPLSPTAKAFGLFHPERKNYFGVQATVEGNFDPHTIKTYFGNQVCPGLFAWIAPESATLARIGLAMLKNSKAYFDLFIQQQGFKVKELQAGTIPLYHPRQKLYQNNCYVLGDAAGYVKATTLGGLIPGLKQAQILADCLVNNKNYQKEIAPLKRKLWLHLQVQKILNQFTDGDWDLLISYVSQPKVERIFQKYTRDNPIPLVAGVLLTEPRFLRFLKHVV